jgi:amidase
LPDPARTTGVYRELLSAAYSADLPPVDRARVETLVASLSLEDRSIRAAFLRGLIIGHPTWIRGSRGRASLRAQWQALFQEVDVILCPPMPTPAFPHDHSTIRVRQLDIDGTKVMARRFSIVTRSLGRLLRH